MRHIKLLVTIALIQSCSSGVVSEKQKIPTEVTNSFQRDFSNFTALYWEIENGDFEAQFLVNGVEMSAIYDRNGMLWEVEETIDVAELPFPAIKHIRTKLPGATIDEASMVTLKPDKILYEAEVNGKDLIFNEYGLFLKEGRE